MPVKRVSLSDLEKRRVGLDEMKDFLKKSWQVGIWMLLDFSHAMHRLRES